MIIDGVRAADRTNALILRYCTAFNRADWDGLVDCLAEDVVHDINQGAREIGRVAFRAILERTGRSYREELCDIVVMSVDDGTRAAAEFTVHGVYHATESGMPMARGQSYVLPAGAFFAIHQGKIARVAHCYNLHERTAQIARAS